MDLLGFEVEARSPAADGSGGESAGWFAATFGVVPQLRVLVGDLDAAVAELRAKGIEASPVDVDDDDEGLVRAVRVHGPGGLVVDVLQPVPPGHHEARIDEFISSAADLDGPPTEELADAVFAIVAAASEAIGARLEGVAHNKVLATHLLLSQQSRRDGPDSPAYWRRSAASTLLSWFVGRGASS